MSNESVKNFLIEADEKTSTTEIKMPERSGRIERDSSEVELMSTLPGIYSIRR